jgi:hypothetical protein
LGVLPIPASMLAQVFGWRGLEVVGRYRAALVVCVCVVV